MSGLLQAVKQMKRREEEEKEERAIMVGEVGVRKHCRRSTGDRMGAFVRARTYNLSLRQQVKTCWLHFMSDEYTVILKQEELDESI